MKKVLFVEDNPNDLELALETFSGEIYIDTIIVAKDGQSALDYLYISGSYQNRDPGNPVLIILDIKLPKIDGLEVLKRVKSDPILKNIPIIMFTGSAEDSDLKTSYALGANAYVVKPINFAKYAQALQSISNFWTKINEPPHDSELDV
ncbi:response regulator [Armatimonas sp.]|uniref:response regulator n=1 Tax=Armatimonas sp. TaxID=1872638 RepID=UPI003751F174